MAHWKEYMPAMVMNLDRIHSRLARTITVTLDAIILVILSQAAVTIGNGFGGGYLDNILVYFF